jgi:dipeptidase
MNRNHSIFLTFFPFFLLLLIICLNTCFVFSQTESGAGKNSQDFCTAILVGKNASMDGSTLTLQTADCGRCDFTFRYVPAADFEAGAMRKIYSKTQYAAWPTPEKAKETLKNEQKLYQEWYTGIEISQVGHTHAYVHGVFGHINEKQLGINESTIGCRYEMRNPNAKICITELTMLAMERCKTAREAIQLMGSIAEKYGYGGPDSGEMLAVSDPEEVWELEIMPVGSLWTPESGEPGAVWAAQRVPDDEVGFCPNESRISEIVLDDPDYFMASSNVVSFAVEKGFYDPESGKPFRFNMAYSPQTDSAISSRGRRARMWRLFDLVAPSRKFSIELPNHEFPFSVKPDKKVSVRDLMGISRDNYEGSQLAPGEGVSGGPFGNPRYHSYSIQLDGKNYSYPRTISKNTAEYTTIVQLRNWLPDEIGGILWLALGAQDTSCYMPFYAGVNAIPESLTVGNHWEMNRDSARKAMDYVDFHTAVAYNVIIEDVKEAQLKWEEGALAQVPKVDLEAYDLYLQDPEKAREYLTHYCIDNTNQVIDAWWKLADDLFVKYNHFRIYTVKDGQQKSGRIELPEWYQRLIVEKENLSPVP